MTSTRFEALLARRAARRERRLAAERITQATAEAWAEPQSLPGLCTTMIGWLAGELPWAPGYDSPVDVDEDEAPGLTSTLIAMNQAGFLTTSSQAGSAGLGYDGAYWTQLASVEGHGDLTRLETLRTRLVGSGFRIDWKPVSPDRGFTLNGVIVTRREGRRFTTFGNQLNRRQLRFEFTGCSANALAAIEAAQQFVIWDPLVGRNTLWPTLHRAVTS